MNTKPTLILVIAWATLASGIVNIGFGIAAFTTFIGWVCAPASVLPIVLGAFELGYAAKLFNTPMQPLTPSTNVAVFEIASILYGNVFSMAVGILALVFYNDAVVKEYFARLNGTLEIVPASTPNVKPDPVILDPIAPLKDEPPTPPTDDQPAPPKRAPRKTA